VRGVGGEAACHRVLDRRLNPDSRRPIAVALSGGGDSVALLLAAQSWAQVRGRPLVALTVDHQLQSQSRTWTEACARLAARVGVGFQALAWEGQKPTSGLPAAARTARHRLLADAARGLDARVLLLGHTADDVLEARAMRAAGATTPEPREWSPSPAWPEGRGLFLLRPLLGVRRAALRDGLTACGEPWIEDPANADPRFARARARAGLSHAGEIDFPADAPLALAELCRFEPWGGVGFPRAALRAAPLAEAERLVGLAAVCAGGGARLPARAARDGLSARLRGAAAEVVATLAGARIEASAEALQVDREAGEARRGGLQPRALAAGEAVVWDGRFEVVAAIEGLEVRPLRGLARWLPEDQRRRLAELPAAARPALPAIVAADGGVSCPQLGVSPAQVESLVEGRLRAAAGLVTSEPP
jgi:tRNA(Ile)-lysidine synthase